MEMGQESQPTHLFLIFFGHVNELFWIPVEQVNGEDLRNDPDHPIQGDVLWSHNLCLLMSLTSLLSPLLQNNYSAFHFIKFVVYLGSQNWWGWGVYRIVRLNMDHIVLMLLMTACKMWTLNAEKVSVYIVYLKDLESRQNWVFFLKKARLCSAAMWWVDMDKLDMVKFIKNMLLCEL